MKPHRTHADDHLLQHVVADSAPDDFRAATLDAMLRGARRRRYLRRARATASALTLPALAIALLWLRLPRIPAPPAGVRVESPPLVEVSARPPSLLVPKRAHPDLIMTSRPLSPDARVATRLLAAGERMRTDTRLGPSLINDDELLALAPESSVLVRLPSGGARLLIPGQTPLP